MSLFKTNTSKYTVYRRGKKLSKPRKQNTKQPFISEDNKKKKDRIIIDIWTRFETEEEKEERKKPKKRKKQNDRLLKDKIIRHIRSFFEEEDDYYKPKRGSSFWDNNYIEYKSNGDKNSNLSLDVLIKLNLT